MPAPRDPEKREEWLKHLSESHMGICSGNRHPMYGKHHTEKTKRKMSESHQDYFRRGNKGPMYGKHHSEEAREKISKANKAYPIKYWQGKHFSEEHKAKISAAEKGKLPWNTGKQLSQEHRKKIGKAGEGRFCSEETRLKLSRANMGHPVSFETRIKLSKAGKGKKLSIETKRKMSMVHKGKKLRKEHVRKILCRRIPTSLEQQFQLVIDKFDLPYKYVGNGSFIIGNLNPDFININNEKIAIEVYADYFKQLEGRDIEKWKKERIKIFKSYGWKILFLNKTQVKENYILKCLKQAKNIAV